MTRRPLLIAMSHGLIITAVAVLLVNDHILKKHWPSTLTGKLSDIAGLVFFPLMVGAIIELCLPSKIRRSATVLGLSIAATGVMFAAIQLHPMATDAYRHGLGAFQYPFQWLLDPETSLAPVVSTPDPTDLIALPALWVAWRIGIRATRPPPKGSDLGDS